MVVNLKAPDALQIRTVTTDDLAALLPLVQELRPHLDLALLEERFAEGSALGYEMHAVYRDGTPVALAGFRPVVSLSRGRYMHLDDLVVASTEQRSGVGRLLLAHVESEAMRRGETSVFLDARPTAIPFYTKCAYAAATSPSYWKALKR